MKGPLIEQLLARRASVAGRYFMRNEAIGTCRHDVMQRTVT